MERFQSQLRRVSFHSLLCIQSGGVGCGEGRGVCKEKGKGAGGCECVYASTI